MEKNGDQEPIDLSDNNENIGLYQFNKTNITNENVNDINETATDVTFETAKNENNETAITEDNWFVSVGTVEETTENNHNQEEGIAVRIKDLNTKSFFKAIIQSDRVFQNAFFPIYLTSNLNQINFYKLISLSLLFVHIL